MAGNVSAVLVGTRSVEVQEAPSPTAGAHEVLVRIRSVGVCGSDVHYFEHGRIGDFVVRGPLVLGHEASGVVVEAGPGASLAVGQRVAIEPGWPDGTCEHCLAGRYNLCPDVQFLATPPVDGAFTELLSVPQQFAHPVPDSLSDDAAALIEPLSVGIAACRKAGVSPGSRVLVTGGGPVGLLVAAVAAAAGATSVVVVETSPERRARSVGLTTAIVVPPEEIPADAVFDAFVECSGAAPALRLGLDRLRPAGVAVLVGMGADEVPVPVTLVQVKELVVTGTFRYANTYPAAIRLAASGAVDLDAFVDRRFTLDDVEGALTATRLDPSLMKVVVTP